MIGRDNSNFECFRSSKEICLREWIEILLCNHIKTASSNCWKLVPHACLNYLDVVYISIKNLYNWFLWLNLTWYLTTFKISSFSLLFLTSYHLFWLITCILYSRYGSNSGYWSIYVFAGLNLSSLLFTFFYFSSFSAIVLYANRKLIKSYSVVEI